MTLFLTSDPVGRFHDARQGQSFPLKADNGFVEELRRVLPEGPRVLFAASDPDFPDRSDEAAAMYREAFARSGLPLGCIHVLDRRNPDRHPRDYDLVILAGGHVPTENAFFRELRLREKLRDYGGAVMGISAGTMNCAGTVYAQPELPGEATDPDYLRFLPGLGLTEINVLPHWQEVREEVLDGLRLLEDITLPDSAGRSFYALVDGSYILVEKGEATLRGLGWEIRDGTVTALCGPGEQRRLPCL